MATIEILTSDCTRHVVVALGGELDVTGSGQVEAAIGEVVSSGRSVIVGATDLDYIDCAALSALRRLHGHARLAGSWLSLAGPCGEVLRLLAVTDMMDAGWVHASVAAAIAATCDGASPYGTGRRAVVPVRGGRAAPFGTGPV